MRVTLTDDQRALAATAAQCARERVPDRRRCARLQASDAPRRRGCGRCSATSGVFGLALAGRARRVGVAACSSSACSTRAAGRVLCPTLVVQHHRHSGWRSSGWPARSSSVLAAAAGLWRAHRDAGTVEPVRRRRPHACADRAPSRRRLAASPERSTSCPTPTLPTCCSSPPGPIGDDGRRTIWLRRLTPSRPECSTSGITRSAGTNQCRVESWTSCAIGAADTIDPGRRRA